MARHLATRPATPDRPDAGPPSRSSMSTTDAISISSTIYSLSHTSLSTRPTSLADTDHPDDHSDDEIMLHPAWPEYLALLVCPVCEAVFDAPTTLRCGHTVCTSHVVLYEPAPPPPAPSPTPGPSILPSRLRRRQRTPTPPHTPLLQLPPTCPLPTCPSNPVHSPTQITIPSTSRVAYFPAPSLPVQNRVRAEPRVDVTVSKIISLVRRAQREEQVSDDDDDDSETEDEYDTPPIPSPPPPTSSSSSPNLLHRPERPTLTPLHFASGSRPRPPSTSPTSTLRPRKRRKRTGWRRSGGGGYDACAEATDDVGRMSVQARFEKDLLAEVTCEICFMLLYQPVTTPCQHLLLSFMSHRPPHLRILPKPPIQPLPPLPNPQSLSLNLRIPPKLPYPPYIIPPRHPNLHLPTLLPRHADPPPLLRAAL
ncbi:hypothetical protein PILCRDRAFT_17280 [Piloderma croceum F 1598]|uniref:Zinc finger RING-type eukaryotic domain-containing protein n=1 Tax=Piloderma croceum (strain F 1598) TaxID=765440 RepID=A0A0C3ETS7_PILCF|nr:hypothetical protein PILCRDRAFT_17280 [Piloderma croceum F 1598]